MQLFDLLNGLAALLLCQELLLTKLVGDPVLLFDLALHLALLALFSLKALVYLFNLRHGRLVLILVAQLDRFLLPDLGSNSLILLC